MSKKLKILTTIIIIFNLNINTDINLIINTDINIYYNKFNHIEVKKTTLHI